MNLMVQIRVPRLFDHPTNVSEETKISPFMGQRVRRDIQEFKVWEIKWIDNLENSSSTTYGNLTKSIIVACWTTQKLQVAHIFTILKFSWNKNGPNGVKRRGHQIANEIWVLTKTRNLKILRKKRNKGHENH